MIDLNLRSSPTDRSARPVRAADSPSPYEGVPSPRLRKLMYAAATENRMDEARHLRDELRRRRAAEMQLEEEVKAAARRRADRVEEEASARGNQCDLTPHGCRCAGRLDYVHQRFAEELRRPAISEETKAAVGALLGYPPKAKRLAAIFGGTRGYPIMPGFEWTLGALEEDWLELLELARRPAGGSGGPQRNLRDGSVREGWVRMVLGSIVARRRTSGGEQRPCW